MSIEMRKVRAKILKRILNSLTVEINELKTRGESDIEELENARVAIRKFCDKLWPFAVNSAKIKHSRYGTDHKHLIDPMKRAA